MSVLETDTRPILSAMLRDFAVPLGFTSQRTLATWACKTALLLDRVGSCDVPSAIPHAFYVERTPAQNWRVWLARHDGPAACMMQGSLLFDLDDRNHIFGWLATFAVGAIAFQVLTPFPGEDMARWGEDSVPAAAIWPYVAPTRWPPHRSLTWFQLAAFASRTS